MKQPLKPRDKITQRMTRDGLTLDNQTTGESVNISSREAEQEYTAEPGGAAEKVLERADKLHSRHKAKKAAKDAGEVVTEGGKALHRPASRLQFTAEERASPELAPYIKKAEKRANKLDAAKDALPKKRVVTKETVYDEAKGKAKSKLHFEKVEKDPPKLKSSPASRPVQEAGLYLHGKIHEVEHENVGVEGGHKGEELAERQAGKALRSARRRQKLKPYRAAAKAERKSIAANAEYMYQKSLRDNPEMAQAVKNPVSRFWQKQKIKRQYLTDDMQPTAESLVSGLWPLLPFAKGLDLSPQFGRVLDSKKVSDHHAILPTMEFISKGFDGLTEGEKKLLSLVCCKLLCAVAAPYVYEAVTATFTCAGNEFTAKGKTVLTPGWKELDRRFKASFKTDADEDAPELARELPELTEGQTFDKVEASATEHFTTPPKPYTEDTLLSAMERAGAEDMPEDAERQGLGTPATRASILEKLVQMGFIERKGKQLLPTKDGHNLACVLPDVLTSPQLTAQWETELTAIAKGEADPEGFMQGIAEMTRGLIANYSQISEDAQQLFQKERVVIGKCPRCGESVYEGKKNYYCGNRACQFVMWKNDRFFEERKKAFTPKIAAALLKSGKVKIKGLYSVKTGKTYDGTVLLADTGGKYVNYRIERRAKN